MSGEFLWRHDRRRRFCDGHRFTRRFIQLNPRIETWIAEVAVFEKGRWGTLNRRLIARFIGWCPRSPWLKQARRDTFAAIAETGWRAQQQVRTRNCAIEMNVLLLSVSVTFGVQFHANLPVYTSHNSSYASNCTRL